MLFIAAEGSNCQYFRLKSHAVQYLLSLSTLKSSQNPEEGEQTPSHCWRSAELRVNMVDIFGKYQAATMWHAFKILVDAVKIHFRENMYQNWLPWRMCMPISSYPCQYLVLLNFNSFVIWDKTRYPIVKFHSYHNEGGWTSFPVFFTTCIYFSLNS